MGRQFRVYLLPSDTEKLFHSLHRDIDFRLVQASAHNMTLVDLGIPTDHCVLQGNAYVMQTAGADVRLRRHPKISEWRVSIESEVIEFSRCTFDGQVLKEGRFYFQTDYLAANQQEILKKRPEFVQWAERFLRHAKRCLCRDAELAAYLGSDAESFWRAGGTLRQF